MIVADLLRAAAIGVAGSTRGDGRLKLWQLAVAVALTGVGDALFRPAFGSIVPEIVQNLCSHKRTRSTVRPNRHGDRRPRHCRDRDRSFGAGTALLIDAATFLISTATALKLTPRPMPPSKKPSFTREAREGFGFVRERPWLWASLVASAFMNVAVAARTVLLPYLIKNDLHKTALGLGIVAAATGAGALICALIVGQRGLPHRHVLAMYTGWTVFLIAITAYGIGTSITELACFAFLGGAGLSLGNAIWGTMMHRLVPRELLGRVTSIDLFFAFSLMPLYTILVGLIAASVGARATLIAAGATGALICIGFLIATPGLRDSEPTEACPYPPRCPTPSEAIRGHSASRSALLDTVLAVDWCPSDNPGIVRWLISAHRSCDRCRFLVPAAILERSELAPSSPGGSRARRRDVTVSAREELTCRWGASRHSASAMSFGAEPVSHASTAV